MPAALDTFEEFAEQAKSLFDESPETTRLVVKYRHADGKAYVRCTNDKIHLKITTNQQADLRKLERLQAWMFAAMCGVEEDEDGLRKAKAAEAARLNPPSPARKRAQTQGKTKKGRRR